MQGWSTSGSLGSDYGKKTMARIRCGALGIWPQGKQHIADERFAREYSVPPY